MLWTVIPASQATSFTTPRMFLEEPEMEALQISVKAPPPRYQWLSQVTCTQGSREAKADDAYAGSPHLPAKPEAST